jgi:hypothetical protein
MRSLLTILLLTQWLVVSCVTAVEEAPSANAPTAAPPCPIQGPATATDEEVIELVLMAEGRLVVEQKIDDLLALWSAGAEIVNAKNTPNNSSDDQSWLGKDAIRHRYVRTVFPGAPSQVSPKDLQIQLETERAVVTATTQIGDEVSPAGDRWVLVKRNTCWEIQSLTYNLETN